MTREIFNELSDFCERLDWFKLQDCPTSHMAKMYLNKDAERDSTLNYLVCMFPVITFRKATNDNTVIYAYLNIEEDED